ncbi:MAG: hypothetical protein ACLU5J_09770 [Christensenellales bacterium]
MIQLLVVYDEENTLIAFAIGYLRKQYIDNLEVAGIVNAIIDKKNIDVKA